MLVGREQPAVRRTNGLVNAVAIEKTSVKDRNLRLFREANPPA
jgi:hypothetical protein